MPIYRYRCKKCGKEFDFLHKSMAASEEVRCEACGEKDVERVLAPFSVGADTTSSGSGGAGGSCPTCCPGGSCSLM